MKLTCRNILRSPRKSGNVCGFSLILVLAVLLPGHLALAADPGDLVINEIMQNPTAASDSVGEWFELHNPTGSAVDIDGWTIEDNDFDSHLIDNGGPLVVPAGGYLVLGRNGDTGINGGVAVDYAYDSFFTLSNGADEIVLLDDIGTEIDRVEYDGGPNFPDPTGASMALTDPALDNNAGANWCEASSPFGFGDLGTPGRANDCPGGTPVVVINEIMQNPSAVSDGAGEWFELHNPTGHDIDIDGWTIRDEDIDTHVINNGGPLLIPAGGYLVLGVNGDPGTNGGVTVDYGYGSSFFLANGADELVLIDNSGTEIDRVEWDSGATFPFPNGTSMALIEPALDNNDGANWCESSTPFGDGDLGTPGAANDCLFRACGYPATAIHDIQGSGPTSPLIGTAGVVIEGVVVGDFQASNELGGFFVQEEDSDADANSLTSEGIFVYDSGFGTDVSVGDVVRVQGNVAEYFGLTELSAVSNIAVCSSGASTSAAAVTLPVATIDHWEGFEGMLVTIPETLVATEIFNLGRYGEVELADARLFAPTQVAAPGSAALAEQDENDLSSIMLDDGSNVQNPLPLPPYLGADGTLRMGDTFPELTGVLAFSRDRYRIHQTVPVSFERVNTRPVSPPDVGGTLTVASFNVFNYFTTIDEGGAMCGPDGDLGCRGADSASEFERQREKLIAAISAMDADVVGILELENNAVTDTVTAIDNLVEGLNAEMGAGTYAYVDTGPIGKDAIKAGFLYKPATVDPVGPFAVLDSSVAPTFLDDNGKNRPSLAQTFQKVAGGGKVTVVVNHFKSKGIPCDSVGDPDEDDGQGNCNLTRKAAATAMVNWLATDPTGSGDPDFLILGDLNSYAMEDPVAAITGAGYTDLIDDSVGIDAYTFVFSGQAGYIDHALANASLTSQVTDVAIWHINADEPKVLDYDETFNQPGLYNPDPFRSSDHDPVLIGLDLEASALACDINASGSVDITDIRAILAVRNTQAVPGDARDVDGDGVITVLDARQCVVQCTNPRCAP